jgi:hypothetical protein
MMPTHEDQFLAIDNIINDRFWNSEEKSAMTTI